MKCLFFFVALFLSTFANAQFAIGKRTITFNDPNRSGGFGSGGGAGRQIQTEIYYPAANAGNNTPLANGVFPVITFGHGFVMTWEAYQNIWEFFVPKGFILAFPRTEAGFSPNHLDFALDLRVVNERMKLEGQTSNSPFYEKISDKTALMGHSMGGGASILAAENYTEIDCVVGLAPAETTPSAITASSNISLPTIIISGSQDGVTPPSQHHVPIYNALTSTCKMFVSINGGGHCYFANANLNCDLGEATASTGISITRTQQQNITQGLLLHYFNTYLKAQCFQTLQSALQSQSGINTLNNCGYTALSINANIVQPNLNNGGSIEIIVSGGTPPYSYQWSNGAKTKNIQNLAGGIHTLIVSDAQRCQIQQSFVLDSVPNALNEKDKLFKFFPNPIETHLYIEGIAQGEKITIQNYLGQIVYANISANNSLEVPFFKQSKGTYVLCVGGKKYKIIK